MSSRSWVHPSLHSIEEAAYTENAYERQMAPVTRQRAKDTRSERFWLNKWQRHDARMYWVELGFGLYAPTFEESLRDLIRADIAEYLGFGIEQQVDTVELEEGHWSENPEGSPFCTTCKSFNLDIFESEAGWGCEKCNAPITTIFGCLNCTRVVCEECVTFKRRAPDQCSLQDIAKNFDLPVERIRSLLNKALRKLRHPSRSRLLGQFLYEDKYSIEHAPPVETQRPCRCNGKYLFNRTIVWCSVCGNTWPRALIDQKLLTKENGQGSEIFDLVAGWGFSLIDTRNLPDGATCYVEESRRHYRLDKASTASENPPLIVAPIIGPGRWFHVSAASVARARARAQAQVQSAYVCLDWEMNPYLKDPQGRLRLPKP